MKKYLALIPISLIFFFSHHALAARNFGSGTGDIREAIEWTPTENKNYSSIKIQVGKQGSPTDGLQVKVYVGGSTPEAGTLAATSGTVAGSSMTINSSDFVSFPFSPSLNLSAGTKYFFVLSRTGSEGANYYQIATGTTSWLSWTIAYFTSWQSRASTDRFTMDQVEFTAPNLAFTSPPEATSFPINYNIPFDGDCPENGTDMIRFTNPPYLPSNGYEIDCVGNRFSIGLPARDYGNFYLELFSKGYDTGTPAGQAKYHAGLHYTVDQQFNEWIMNLNYPRCDQNQCITFKLSPTSAYPVRWAYKVPPSADKAQITYRFREYTDNTFQTLKSGGVNFSDNLAHLLTTSDKPELEFHDSHMVVTSNVTQYYKAEMIYGNVVRVFHLFVVTGDSSSAGQVPTLPSIVLGGCSNNQFVSAFCDVFIPSSDFFTNKFNYLNQLLTAKPPFSYFMSLKDKFANVSTSTIDGYFINTTLAISGSHPISVPFQAFNTADSNISNTLNQFRPYMIALLWFGFATYALTRAYRLFRPI